MPYELHWLKEAAEDPDAPSCFAPDESSSAAAFLRSMPARRGGGKLSGYAKLHCNRMEARIQLCMPKTNHLILHLPTLFMQLRDSLGQSPAAATRGPRRDADSSPTRSRHGLARRPRSASRVRRPLSWTTSTVALGPPFIDGLLLGLAGYRCLRLHVGRRLAGRPAPRKPRGAPPLATATTASSHSSCSGTSRVEPPL